MTVTPATDTLRVAAEATDANDHPVTGAESSWASSDTSVVVVDDRGRASGVGAGQTEVTATAAGVTRRADLTVAPAPTTIAVTPDTVALAALGDTVRLSAELLDESGRMLPGAEVAWASVDTMVATVDSAALVTAAGV